MQNFCIIYWTVACRITAGNILCKICVADRIVHSKFERTVVMLYRQLNWVCEPAPTPLSHTSTSLQAQMIRQHDYLHKQVLVNF